MASGKVLAVIVAVLLSLTNALTIDEDESFALISSPEDVVLSDFRNVAELINCPCNYDEVSSSLGCSDLKLERLPVDCFNLYPKIQEVDLKNNQLTEILEHDFEALNETIRHIDLTFNSIYYIHPRAFSTLTELETLYLQNNTLNRVPEDLLYNNEMLRICSLHYNELTDLPRSFFSPSVKNHSVQIIVYPNNFDFVPCSFTAPLGEGSEDSFNYFYRFWAYSEEEKSLCQSFGVLVIAQICRPFGMQGIDCSHLPEAMTPSKAVMAVSESRNWDFGPTDIVFKAEVPSLMGTAPPTLHCLPDGVDVTKTYRLYSRHTKDLVIETFSFDLLDLPRYTSGETHTVTVLADTVVLSGPLAPLNHTLTIVARNIVFEKPLLISVNLHDYPPETVPNFYTHSHERGRVGNVVVEKFQHGLLTALLLQGKTDPADECQPLPDWTTDAEEWVKASQLWLSLQCASAVWEESDVSNLEGALEIMDFVANITTNWNAPALVGLNQRAVKAKQEVHLKQELRQLPRVVPYLTVPIYADMVGYMTENLESYKDAMDELKLKMEVNAQRMFDRSIAFTDRMADLQMIESSAQMAVDKAEATMGAHENQLDSLYQQTFTMWDGITKTYEEVEKTKIEVETAIERVEEGMKAYKRRRRFVVLLDFASLSINVTNGIVDLRNGNITNRQFINETVTAVADFLPSWNTYADQIGNMLGSVHDLMADVNAILAAAPQEPPSIDEMASWLNAFKDTEKIVKVATNQTVAQLEWQGIRDTCTLVLSDEELSDAVDGVRQLKLVTYDLIVLSQSLSDYIVIFSNLIISINQQVSVVEDDYSSVTSSQESLFEVLDLINDASITSDNYLDHMVDQNLAIAKLMTQLYLKNRVDLLAAFNILGEYCDAFFYTFLMECPVRASYWDDFDAMFFKLKQLDVLALDAVGSLDPPPQPFTMAFSIQDAEDCDAVTDSRCPVTQLANTGRTELQLSEWWGPELDYTDRVRIDRLRFYLEGSELTQVTLSITRPLMFNDTWQGETHHFTGHVTNCVVIYEDFGFTGMEDANYITDCSTNHLYQKYYYRSTPRGSFSLVLSEFVPGTNISDLVSIEVLVEGSWVPRLGKGEE